MTLDPANGTLAVKQTENDTPLITMTNYKTLNPRHHDDHIRLHSEFVHHSIRPRDFERGIRTKQHLMHEV